MDLECNIPMAVTCFVFIPRSPLQLLLLLSSITVFFFPTKPAIAIILPKHNNATDRISLLLFKSAISGDPHGVFTLWNDTVHFCQWHGITCGGHQHQERVVALRLPELDFVGIISPALANLTFLRMINLTSNNFHGQIPSELGNLPRLRELHISFNSLDGFIPSQLSQCAGLQAIYLSYNMLGGYIPKYGMTSSVSTHGDIYSYGILLLEMFTGKRPTDDTFKEGVSLRIFVEMAFPEQVMNIMDVCILEEGVEEHKDDGRKVNNTRYLDCVASVLRIGLLCTKDVPMERMEMKAVTNELKTIRKVLLQH